MKNEKDESGLKSRIPSQIPSSKQTIIQPGRTNVTGSNPLVYISSSSTIASSAATSLERSEGLLSRLWQRLMDDPAFAYAWTIFLTHRLLLFALGAALVLIAPVEPPLGVSLLRDLNPNFWGPGFLFLEPWQRWDTNWYIRIAMTGYDIGNGTTNYPPLYPVSIALLGRLLLGQYMLASLVISNLAYIVALVYLYRLTSQLFDETIAKRTLVWVAVFPSAFFLASGYTESLFLALAVASFYYGEKKRWWLAAGLAALAGVTRIQGLVLVLPLGYLYMQQRGWNWRKIGREAFALALSPGLLALYFGYVFLILGDNNFSNHLSVIWSVRFAWPWDAFVMGLAGLFDPNYANLLIYNGLDLITLVIFICLAIIWWQRKLPRHYLIFVVSNMLVYLTRAGTSGFVWMSMTRYLVVLFPCFMLLAQIAPKRYIKLSAVVQAVWAFLFIFWMWAG